MQSFSRETGGGLVSALVAIALLAIGIVIVNGLMTNLNRTRKAVELKADATLLKKNLLSATDCKATPICQPDQLRQLLDYDGRVLVNANGKTKFGLWTVQARCQADLSLEIRVALLDAQDHPVKDPLRGKLMDWQAPEGILIESGILCGTVNTAAPVGQNFSVQTSAVCTPTMGSCLPFPESSIDPGVPATICCDDGRDMPKPKCQGQSQEYAAYWDRQNDWGMSGQWVVLCQ